MINLLEECITFVNMVIKYPFRIVCKKNKEHDWYWHGGGFSIIKPKYSFICKKCGCRSIGDTDDFEKKDS